MRTSPRYSPKMSVPPLYAPTGASSYTPASGNTHVNFHEEVTRASLIPTPAHKAVCDSLCEIYSIVTVMEMVENAFVKDYITDKEKYTLTVLRLVNQYQVLLDSLRKSPSHEEVLLAVLPGISADHGNILECLAQKFSLQCSLAIDRLTKKVPATLEHLSANFERAGDERELSSTPAPGENKKASARLVAEATGNFITLMDALKLSYNSKAQLHPLLSNLVISLNDMLTRDAAGGDATLLEFPAKSKLVSWLIKLNNLQDLEVLAADDIERFLQDLDTAYRGFYESLE